MSGDMLAFGTKELNNLPLLGRRIRCPQCGKNHKVQYAVDDEGVVFLDLGFYKCRGKSYLCGVAGKDITFLVSKE